MRYREHLTAIAGEAQTPGSQRIEVGCLYSPSCLEAVFSETELPLLRRPNAVRVTHRLYTCLLNKVKGYFVSNLERHLADVSSAVADIDQSMLPYLFPSHNTSTLVSGGIVKVMFSK